VSEILGTLILALVAIGFCARVATEISQVYYQVRGATVLEGVPSRPVDRVAIIRELVGAIEPAYVQTQAARLEADDRGPTAHDTQRRIGSVAVVGAMTPCDAVTDRSIYYTCRDFGDEDDASSGARNEEPIVRNLDTPSRDDAPNNGGSDAVRTGFVRAPLGAFVVFVLCFVGVGCASPAVSFHNGTNTNGAAAGAIVINNEVLPQRALCFEDFGRELICVAVGDFRRWARQLAEGIE
jgi:hypothetical protein